MKWVGWVMGTVLALLVLDELIGWFTAWRAQRIRTANARKWGFVTYERSAKTKRL